MIQPVRSIQKRAQHKRPGKEARQARRLRAYQRLIKTYGEVPTDEKVLKLLETLEERLGFIRPAWEIEVEGTQNALPVLEEKQHDG